MVEYNLFNGKKSLETVLDVEYNNQKNIQNPQMINETIGLISNSKTIPLQWNRVKLTSNCFKMQSSKAGDT